MWDILAYRMQWLRRMGVGAAVFGERPDLNTLIQQLGCGKLSHVKTWVHLQPWIECFEVMTGYVEPSDGVVLGRKSAKLYGDILRAVTSLPSTGPESLVVEILCKRYAIHVLKLGRYAFIQPIHSVSLENKLRGKEAFERWIDTKLAIAGQSELLTCFESDPVKSSEIADHSFVCSTWWETLSWYVLD